MVTTTALPVTLGPFQLDHGRTQISMVASPGPRRYGTDPRLLSVQVALLGGYTSPAEA